ncbi:putative E3 ubiquitin-protein ligase SHPRH-like isoform X1 [Penaeus vannamei]|uniref:Putative E3 ubiquitin-protein ligase SHPRH-like isoform X1 n=1 Tax=Penaeus vannamei TaxID=6689 RepID=A0A423SAB5_PENVA|nr:putative E3 ubiquitin-protein ligase SHPRH-like isoform X1 [Penaeus vannamei]
MKLKHDTEVLYKAVKEYHNNIEYVDLDVQHSSLIPQLRPYQKAAVRWMLHQENYGGDKQKDEWELHCLFTEIKCEDGTELYYNRYGGFIVKDKPLAVAPSPGGILADEMGLGKTVEVLSCILNHPRKEVPKPEYQEPVRVEQSRKRKSAKKDVAGDVYTLHQEENEDEDNAIDSKSHIELSCNKSPSEEKEETPAKRGKGRAARKQQEISEDTHWSSIESVIINECWEGKAKEYKKEGSYKDFRKYLKMKKKDPYHMMSLKERLQAQYKNSIAEYSAVGFVSKRAIQGFFDLKVEQKSYFECICGSTTAENRDEKFRVQCSVCSLWQHAECVQFDVSDPYRGVYICPHCWTQETPVVSEATLIVTPSSISYQWVDEIMKHLKNKALRMLVYKGVATQGYMQPRFLGNFDIVITTYETLRQELNYVDLPHSNSEMGRRCEPFRHPKRFMATPSPLPCVEWWRVCLDEAQMVECTTTKTAEMALRLAAINRWCVTGTPVQKSVNDLQGLLMFLGVDPYGVAQWWHRCLYVPYCHHQKEPLHNLVSQYLWRNAKKDVIHQIDIPKQMEEIHWLTFTRVEEHFYQRLHAECSYDAQQRLKKFSDPKTKLSDLDRQTLSSLLHPLLKLRQACNHPQVVKGQFMSINRKTMTMEMLLDNLIKKTKLESEEAHRLLVASMNGLAGVHIIKEEWVEAVNVYRGVLQSIEEHSNIKTDSLQRLHTLHNLAELIESNHQGVAPTLRDSTLREQAEAIRKRYLQHHPQQVTAANEECTSNTEAVDELKSQYNSRIDWWLGALQSFDNDFVQELTSMLDLAIDCHLRPTELEPPQCLLCATHEFFEDYEETLFSMKELKHSRTTGVSKETEDVKDKAQVLQATRRGNWGQSETERVLRYLQTRCLGKVENEIYEDSHVYFQSLEAMKKEFKNYRILWRSLFDSVSAMDEVNMATIRLRLRFPDEELPQQKKKKNGPDLDKKVEALRYVIEPAELDQQEIKLKSDQIVAKNDLRIKLGQLLYLQNLSKTDFGKEGGKNPEPCPICQGDLGEKWAVLLCGHCYCMECMRTLSNRGFNGLDKSNVKCPMCRQPTRTREISYVDTKAKEEEEYIKVQGSLSTKVEGVVRLMLKIKLSDPEAKVLVFSSWVDVLDVIADAFAQNGITFRALHQHSKFQKHLASFKSNSLISALLLPISSGANGLNIIEAAHVILVEPILNPAAELQAIGRIHRIGQTKETTVHRFLVRDTIEDRMHHILKHHHAIIHTDENTVTIEDLRNLFLHPEELELQREIALGTSQHNGTDSPQCDSQPQEGSGEGSGCRTSSGSTAASVANGSVLSALESSDSVSSPSTSKQSVSHCNSDYVTVVKASSSWLQPDEDQPSTSGHSADELSCDRNLNPDSPASEFFMCEAPERNSLQSSCTHEVDSAVLPLDSAPQEIDMSPAAPRDNTVPLSPSSSLHDR